MAHFKMPFLNPIKFVPTAMTGIHLDDTWQRNQIAMYEMNGAKYYQKFIWKDVVKLQCESSSNLPDLEMWYTDPHTGLTAIAETFEWVQVVTGVGYGVYEVTIDLTSAESGNFQAIVFFRQQADLGTIQIDIISEPVWYKPLWPGTLPVKYKNATNDFDVAFTAVGIEFLFRCELAIPPTSITPKRDSTDYQNQNNQITVLSAFPTELFELNIGGTGYDQGVAPWVIKLLSRIFACSSVKIADKFYVANTGEDIKTQPIKGRPLLTATLTIAEGVDRDSLEFNDTPDGTTETGNTADLVIGFEYDTDFFAPGATVPVIEIIEQE